MINFIWHLLFILLGQYVHGETTRVAYRKREDLANRVFSDAHIHFTQTTTALKCVENCFYVNNCVVVMAAEDGGGVDCFLYDKLAVDMTSQVSTNTTHIYERVSSSNSSCPASTTTATTTPVPTQLQFEATGQAWEAARGVCQSRGGDLAMLDTPEKIQNVVDNMSGFEIWIGFNRSTPDGVPKWIDGRGITGVTWYPGFFDSPGELCGSIGISSTAFHKTEECSRNDPFICEVPVSS
ncbi:uncharacterized protein [Haliotis asinina]|uniref:uncharacterized protein n=1 Tax=Haliotis asinina TaxID=109174 RepID=UPI00353238BE